MNTTPTSTTIFANFVNEVDGDELRLEASRLLYTTGSPLSMFSREKGGAVGKVIRQKLSLAYPTLLEVEIILLIGQILAHYKIPQNWIPPTALIREGLALGVQQRKILEQIEGPNMVYEYVREVNAHADEYNSVEEVYKLPFEVIDRITRTISKSD